MAQILDITSPDHVYELRKEPNETETSILNVRDVLAGTTVASAVRSTPQPTTNAPTVTVGTVSSTAVPVQVAGGTAAWNTTGRGTFMVTITMANGDVMELNIGLTIADIVP